MKKFIYFLKSAIAVCAVLMFMTQCTEKQTPAVTSAPAAGSAAPLTTMPIAYINLDSLLSSYDFVKVESEKILKKGENARVTINEKGKKLESEVSEFQRKMQNNAFLTEQRAQQEAMRIPVPHSSSHGNGCSSILPPKRFRIFPYSNHHSF